MKHEVTTEEAEALAEKLLTIANLYAVILEDLEATPTYAPATNFRHRIHPDGMIELEAILTDKTEIHIEFTFAPQKSSQ